MIRRSVMILVVVALGAIGLAPSVAPADASADGSDGRHRVDARVEAPRKTVTIHVRDNSFAPANIAVEDGTTVRWINDGRNDHNVTASKKGDYFESPN
ncbi:MAG TPA: hypothetical protein VK549_13720, partial [Acidimicrobiia bacterium]|nr:hypothetical protein [Acidimicrobiia bacterium]